MAIKLSQRAQVQPGHRLELLVPEIAEGQLVDVIIVDAAPAANESGKMTREQFFDWLRNLPPSGRTVEEIDAQIEEERNSWD